MTACRGCTALRDSPGITTSWKSQYNVQGYNRKFVTAFKFASRVKPDATARFLSRMSLVDDAEVPCFPRRLFDLAPLTRSVQPGRSVSAIGASRRLKPCTAPPQPSRLNPRPHPAYWRARIRIAFSQLDGSGTSQKGRTAGSRCVDQQLTLAEVKVWNGMWKERPERTGMA